MLRDCGHAEQVIVMGFVCPTAAAALRRCAQLSRAASNLKPGSVARMSVIVRCGRILFYWVGRSEEVDGNYTDACAFVCDVVVFASRVDEAVTSVACVRMCVADENEDKSVSLTCHKRYNAALFSACIHIL